MFKFIYWFCYSLCHFKSSQKTDTPQHRETNGRDEIVLDQKILQDTTDDNKEVESVEQRTHVTSKT